MSASPRLEVGLLSLGDGGALPAERHRAIVERAALAERLGFDSLWLGEPLAGGGGPSAPAVVLAAIAARTERLRLGTAVPRVADLDPVRVAEDYATLDGISGGRVELAAGHGPLAGAGDATGPESEEGRARLRETLELVRRLWTETEVTWSGRFRAPLERVTVEPRVVQEPHPPLWIGADGSLASADLAAELGLPLLLPLPSLLAPPAGWASLVARYRERAARYRERAARAGQPARLGACHPVQVGWLLDEAAPCGSPDEVTERILAAREALGLDVELLAFDVEGRPEARVRETLERFGRAVLPHLR